jgi:DNA-binding MarR family transcriptional regulator
MDEVFPEKLISIIHRANMRRLEHHLKYYGIGSGQFLFLISLYCQEGINQEELSRTLGFDKATTTRALNKLEQEGFIYRERDGTDKRSKNIYITAKAQHIKTELQKLSCEWDEKLFQGFTNREKDQMNSFLMRIVENINQK